MSLTKVASQILDEYRIDAKAGLVINAVVALITGLVKKRPISKSKFKKMVDILMKNYDTQSVIMGFLGNALSIHFLLDSNNNRKEVRKFQDRLIDTFKKYPANLWGQRLAEIRADVEQLKSRQLTMGAINFVISAALGCFVYASTASALLRTGAAICSATCGAAAVIHGVNYYNLHELLNRLQRDGRLN